MKYRLIFLDEDITSGFGNLTVQFLLSNKWISLPSIIMDICEEYKCPIKKGPASFSGTVSVPPLTPEV